MTNGDERAQSGMEAVRAQVRRIVASSAFAASDQLKRFLEVAVERAAAGDPTRLKEYSLGVEVFGRPETYDPKGDPIVRVQARRLRAKLQEYYEGEGARDPIVIQVPKGGYVPSFEHRTVPAAAVQPAKASMRRQLWMAGVVGIALLGALMLWRTQSGATEALSVAVLPFENLTGDPGKQYLADKTTEAIITELAKIPTLRVTSRTTTIRYRGSDRSLPDIARELGVRSIVEGGVGSEGGHVLLKMRVVDGAGDRKIWANGYQARLERLSETHALAARAMADAMIRVAASKP